MPSPHGFNYRSPHGFGVRSPHGFWGPHTASVWKIALATTSATVLWHYDLGVDAACVAADAAGNCWAAGAQSDVTKPTVWQLSAATGVVLQTINILAGQPSVPIIFRVLDIAVTASGIYIQELSTGIWKFSLSGALLWNQYLEFVYGGPQGIAAAVVDGTEYVYAVVGSGTLRRLDPSTGNTLWSANNSSSGVRTPAIDASGNLWLGTWLTDEGLGASPRQISPAGAVLQTVAEPGDGTYAISPDTLSSGLLLITNTSFLDGAYPHLCRATIVSGSFSFAWHLSSGPQSTQGWPLAERVTGKVLCTDSGIVSLLNDATGVEAWHWAGPHSLSPPYGQPYCPDGSGNAFVVNRRATAWPSAGLTP